MARQDPGGAFVLRIEDTDEERGKEEYVQVIVDSMHWLGLDFDEGPNRQSDAAEDHQAAIACLLTEGYLYYCDCTADDVKSRKAPNEPPGYDGFCRDRRLVKTPETALRFRTPDEGATIVHDEIRGDVRFDNGLLDDFVVARRNGSALFTLANVVDDRRDGITDVVRGDEHLPNTPRQVLLWEALDHAAGQPHPLPRYAHLPVLVNDKRQKLSKRRDPVGLSLYVNQGYLAPAMINYLALLGWSPRDGSEIVPLATCLEQFRIEDVSHSPAFFDVKKLDHINGEYIRALDPAAFVQACAPWVAPWAAAWRPSSSPPWTESQFDAGVFSAIAPVIQTRVTKLAEVPPMVDFLFLDEPADDPSAVAKTISSSPIAADVLRRVLDALSATEWSADALHAMVAACGEAAGLSLRQAQAPVRVAVTGRAVGPPLFESLALLGRDRTTARLERGLARAAT